MGPRTISVCGVADPAFRLQRPESDDRMRGWFAEVNRIFEPAGIVWHFEAGGLSYSKNGRGTLAERRTVMGVERPCPADVIAGFSGVPDEAERFSAAPFSHTLLIGTKQSDDDAVLVRTLAQSLAMLFGVTASGDAGNGQVPVLDTRAINLIQKLRKYDFSSGPAALAVSWRNRAFDALTASYRGKSEHPEAEAHRVLAQAFRDGNNPARAIEELRQAVRQAPKDASLRLELAGALRQDAADEEALKEVEEAGQLAPNDPRVFAMRGSISGALRRRWEEIEACRSAVKLAPRNGAYRLRLAEALMSQVGRWDEAWEEVREARRLSPSDGEATVAAASIEGARERAQELLARIRAAVRANPGSVPAQVELAFATGWAGSPEEAIAAFRKALTLDPANVRARLALARLYYDKSNYAAAREEVELTRRHGAQVPEEITRVLQRKLSR